MNVRMLFLAGISAALIPFSVAHDAGSEPPLGELRLLDWRPVSQMVVSEAILLQPRFPVIDVHNHLGDIEEAEHYIREMDQAGVTHVVNLDGRSRNDAYLRQLEAYRQFGDRVLTFFAPDFSGIAEAGWGEQEAERFRRAVEAGCRGLKIFKSLGLSVRDADGALVAIDDPRIDPIWAAAGELGVPVMIHTSDPKAFFTAIDRHNERYDELAGHPNWAFFGEEYPKKDDLLAARNRVIARHPGTTFIGAHMANLPEELHIVGNWLDAYPNLHVDIDARISELGRQPYTARDFFIRYQDRVLFGTDTPPNANAYRLYYRFLETRDEYIDPTEAHHLQGRWMIYGLHLPDEVLEKIYHLNARRLLGLD